MMLKSVFFAELKHGILRELSEHIICYIKHRFRDFWLSKCHWLALTSRIQWEHLLSQSQVLANSFPFAATGTKHPRLNISQFYNIFMDKIT